MAEVQLKTGDQFKPTVTVEVPDNSLGIDVNESKAEAKPVAKPIVTGKAIVKKPSKVKKFFGMLIGEDVSDIRGYLLTAVLMPVLRRGLMDMMSALLNTPASPGNPQFRAGTRFSYERAYDNNRARTAGASQGEVFTFDQVVVPTREDAQAVVDQMNELVLQYGCARVSDLYATVGISAPFTYNNWGWYDVHTATWRASREGFIIVMPTAVPIRR